MVDATRRYNRSLSYDKNGYHQNIGNFTIRSSESENQLRIPMELKPDDSWSDQSLKKMFNFSDSEWNSYKFEAVLNAMQRLFQCLLRENLFDENLIKIIRRKDTAKLLDRHKEAILIFRDAFLILRGLKRGRALSLKFNGSNEKINFENLNWIECVWEHLPSFLNSEINAETKRRMQAEFSNSLRIEVLCIAHQSSWAERLKIKIRESECSGFIEFLQTTNEFENPCLVLEQWSSVIGHPLHPSRKTRIGLTPQQVVAWSPEFEADLDLTIAAVSAHLMHVEAMDGYEAGEYRQWFASQFPEIYFSWTQEIRKLNLDPIENWVPLPIHPWQRRQIPAMFDTEIRSKKLLFFDQIPFKASPTISFRSVIPNRSRSMPLLKLPVNLRLSSVTRLVSPKAATMGPRSSGVIKKILTQENGFDGFTGEPTIEILPEIFGLYFSDSSNPVDINLRGGHLSILYRQNPMLHGFPYLFPVPVAALFSKSPIDDRPLVTELIDRAYPEPDYNRSAAATEFCKKYMEIVLNSVLGPYLIYGFSLEAHQQNSFILIDRNGVPKRLLIRDFGDIRFHKGTLEKFGYQLQPYQENFSLLPDRQTVRNVLYQAVLLCHVTELTLALEQIYANVDEIDQKPDFWCIFRQTVERIFEKYKNRMDEEIWHDERDHFLKFDWPVKSFVRMRLDNSEKDNLGVIPNPIALT